MAVTIKKNSGSEFHNEIRKRVERVNIEILIRAGEEAITYARKNGSYTDRTTNLRNSIGYLVLKDGIVVSGKFGRGKVAEKSNAYAIKIAQGYMKGYVLIVVAGMEYAAYVEALGYDVLSGAGNYLKSYVMDTLEQLRKELLK